MSRLLVFLFIVAWWRSRLINKSFHLVCSTDWNDCAWEWCDGLRYRTMKYSFRFPPPAPYTYQPRCDLAIGRTFIIRWISESALLTDNLFSESGTHRYMETGQNKLQRKYNCHVTLKLAAQAVTLQLNTLYLEKMTMIAWWVASTILA